MIDASAQRAEAMREPVETVACAGASMASLELPARSTIKQPAHAFSGVRVMANAPGTATVQAEALGLVATARIVLE